MTNDAVNHPSHYTSDNSGIECIEITRHMGFCDGNCFKYLFRAGDKIDALEDLKKALWYADEYQKNMNQFVNIWRTWKTRKLINKVAKVRWGTGKWVVAPVMELIAQGAWEKASWKLHFLISDIEFEIEHIGYSPILNKLGGINE